MNNNMKLAKNLIKLAKDIISSEGLSFQEIFDKNEIDYKDMNRLYYLMRNENLDNEQRQKIINLFIDKKNTHLISELLSSDDLLINERKLALQYLIDVKADENLYWLIYYKDDFNKFKLTDKQRKQIIDFLINGKYVHHLKNLISLDLLNENERKQALQVLMDENEQKWLNYLKQYNYITKNQLKLI